MDQLLLGVLTLQLQLQLQLAQISIERLQPVAIAAVLQPEDYKTYASTTAEKLGLDAGIFTSVLGCESRYKVDAVGDNGTSYGIAQIHLVAHPDVSKEQALDGIWAIDWAAKEFTKGNARWWSCYRLLGYDST